MHEGGLADGVLEFWVARSFKDQTMVIGALRSVQNNPANILEKGSKRIDQEPTSQVQYHGSQGQSILPLDKSNEVNKTYIVSASKRTLGPSIPSKPEGRLTLQRRKTVDRGNPSIHDDIRNVDSSEGERRLTLQRRTKGGNLERGIGIFKENAESLTQNITIQASNNLLQTKGTNSTGFVSSSLSLMQNVGIARINLSAAAKPTSIGRKQENSTTSSYRSTSVTTINKVHTPTNPSITPVKRMVSGKSDDSQRKTEAKPFKMSSKQNVDRNETLKTDVTKIMKLFNQQETKNQSNFVKSMTRDFQKKQQTMESGINNLKYSINTVADNGDQKPLRSGVVTRGTLRQVEISSTSLCAGNECLNGVDSAVTVAVRVRPFSEREKNENSQQVIFMQGQDTIVQHPETNRTYSFTYDFSFWSFDGLHPEFSSQEAVYMNIGLPLLEKAFEGYNTCLFAYGQTGSGKSYTMMGFSDEGIIPRFCEQLFTEVAKTELQQVIYHIEMSYFEVYNEKIHDLLVGGNAKMQAKQSLRVREHPVFGPFVADLSLNVVTSYADVQGWLELGNKQRATAATGMNEKSSRSHSVFTLIMTQTKTEFVEEEEHEHCVTSKINLVDLAGSERCFTAQTSGDRLKEGVSINKSLFTLGKVISALSEYFQAKKKVFIPYRESVLTWLLKDSLGGNSKTAMIATISPSASNVEETLSTLRYAKQARQIINVAKVNEDSNAKLIRDLKLEIEKLKAAQMSSQGIQSERYKASQKEIKALKLKLNQQEKEMAEAQRRWRERLDEAEKRKLEEARELQKAGITFKVDNSLPNLVNLNEDPQISEMLLYMIKEGQTRVGKQRPNSKHDIQLSGALIADDHCVIQNVNGIVSIAPIGDANTYVNGNLIAESIVLHHGDRVIMGGDHYFKFNHPLEVQNGRASSGNALFGDGPKDFEFAKNELLQAQQARLEVEIEEARLQAKKEMMQGIQVAKEMAQKELSSQKSLYENKIKELEKELVKESQKNIEIEELQNVKKQLKQEMQVNKQLEQVVAVNRKRLELEALATKQALEDHNIRHVKFLDALEAEKRKMTKDLERMQKEQRKRQETQNNTSCKDNSYWRSMKLSMMIREANTISTNLRKHTVFSRHEESDNENKSIQTPIRVQVKNTKLGISTFWSLEKFECKLIAMRELYQQDSTHPGDEDLFYDPNDDWETDLTSSSTLSRRRSRSFFKSKRMSGCLAGIQALSVQNLHSAHSPDLLNVSQSVILAGSESTLPAVCKELLGEAVDFLGRSYLSQENIPVRLITDLLTIHKWTMEISQSYEQLDEESQQSLFTNNRAMQTYCVRATSVFERITILLKLWIDTVPKDNCFGIIEDELFGEVRTLGRNLQLLLQGCDSDISSMVMEAENKISQTIRRLVKHIGHLAAFMSMELNFDEENIDDSPSYKRSVMTCLFEGVESGMEGLLDAGLKNIKDHQKLLQRPSSKLEVFEKLKKWSMALSVSIQNYLMELKKMGTLIKERPTWHPSSIKNLSNVSGELVEFNKSYNKMYHMMTSVLRGENEVNDQLKKCIEMVCSSAMNVAGKFDTLWTFSFDEVKASYIRESKMDKKGPQLISEVELAASSLLDLIESLQNEKANSGCADSNEKVKASTNVHSGTLYGRGVKKTVYTLQGTAPTSEELSPQAVQWV
ncbi:kinesin-like protein KIF14 isoform X1 [Chiloscyllium plagiosum]|uniref:kinesin-like protein KIF14 isoform X1 n=2 Tax=Chiloscyllium plagiosum TaxID=36176 RepID=UPI001CB83F68|nr:kinesin-like protein KIF14 isoform X1 [Chiloscyllium plagiosum]